jgi:hypothetical protein
MTNEPRKATDILLSLEEKINTLTKIVAVYDMNIKLILDRLNKLNAALEQPEQTLSDRMIPEIYHSPPVEAVIPVEDKPTGPRRTSRTEKSDISSDKKVPVSQRITDGTGKDLFMAVVEILSSDKTLISKTKTNAVGKWQAHLKPGDYFIHVVKTDTATKKKIEALQEINIPSSDAPVNLPLIAIRRT